MLHDGKGSLENCGRREPCPFKPAVVLQQSPGLYGSAAQLHQLSLAQSLVTQTFRLISRGRKGRTSVAFLIRCFCLLLEPAASAVQVQFYKCPCCTNGDL